MTVLAEPAGEWRHYPFENHGFASKFCGFGAKNFAVVYAPGLGSSRFPYWVRSLSTVEGIALPPAFFVCPMDQLDLAETRGKKKKEKKEQKIIDFAWF